MDKLPNSNDPYMILNIKYSDSKKKVKRAYVKLIKQYKPEKYPEEFKKIRAAYEQVLKNRKYYSGDIDKDEPVEEKIEPENPVSNDKKEINEDPKTTGNVNEVITNEDPKATENDEVITDENPNKYNAVILSNPWEPFGEEQLKNEEQIISEYKNCLYDDNEEFHVEDQEEIESEKKEESYTEHEHEEYIFNWHEYAENINNNEEPDVEDQQDVKNKTNQDEHEEYVFNWKEYTENLNNNKEREEIVFGWQEYNNDQNNEDQESHSEEEHEEIVFDWQEHNNDQNNEDQESHSEEEHEEIVFDWQEYNNDQNNEDQESHGEEEHEEIVFKWEEYNNDQNNEYFNYDKQSDRNQSTKIWQEYPKNINSQKESGFFSLGTNFPTFQDVYNIWLDEKDSTILRLIELFPYNENTYIFAFLISEIAGDKLEHSSKWLKLAINKGINISYWIEEVFYEYEFVEIVDGLFSWEKLCLIKSKSQARSDLQRYVHLLLYYEKYSTVALLIENDTFLEDSWSLPSLDLVEIALEISCALAWYLPKTGKTIFQKYSGPLEKNIELAARDMYSLYPAWLKTEQYNPRLIVYLKRFLSLSSSSIENIDLVILELYISIIKNKKGYFQLLLFMKQQNPLLLQFILSQIEQHSQQKVTANVPKSIEKKTVAYLFAKNSIYNKISEVLTVFLGFFIIAGGVSLIFYTITLFIQPFHWSYLFSIFAMPAAIFAIVRIIDAVEKHGYQKWLRPNLVNLVTSTFYDFSFINDNEKINIKFDSKEDSSLIVLQQLSLLGSRFLNKNLDINTIFDALIYENARPKGLKMYFFGIFSQMETKKVFEDELKINKKITEEQKKNLLSMHDELQKSPRRFTREMAVIAKRHVSLHTHYKMYLRNLTKKIQKPEKRFPHQNFNRPAFTIAIMIGIICEFLVIKTTAGSILPKTIAFVLPVAFISFFAARQLIYNFKIRPAAIKFIMQTKITPEQLKKCVIQKDLVDHIQDDKVLQAVCWTSRIELLYKKSQE
ncbi:hypothetical protein [Candidatus Uabimicrobium sp. HlEnr_7]|uniref:J domain-containing protein n=1 Tax=Candidatus Uabimicrobium helgolandensis TaxID=3095367 RepID=UPI003558ED16